MTSCEHFLYAQFNGVGYKLIKSPDIDHIITKDSLLYLQQLGHNLKQELSLEGYLPEESVVFNTYLRPYKDEYGRKVVWNHTILMHAKDYVTLHPSGKYSRIFEPHHIKNLSKPPAQLQPIQIK